MSSSWVSLGFGSVSGSDGALFLGLLPVFSVVDWEALSCRCFSKSTQCVVPKPMAAIIPPPRAHIHGRCMKKGSSGLVSRKSRTNAIQRAAPVSIIRRARVFAILSAALRRGSWLATVFMGNQKVIEAIIKPSPRVNVSQGISYGGLVMAAKLPAHVSRPAAAVLSERIWMVLHMILPAEKLTGLLSSLLIYGFGGLGVGFSSG